MTGFILNENDRNILQETAGLRFQRKNKTRYKRRRSGGHGSFDDMTIHLVAIRGPGIPRAQWNRKTIIWNPTGHTSAVFYETEGGWTFDADHDPEHKLSYYNFFRTEIEVTLGKFRIGIVLNNILFNVDCEESDWPVHPYYSEYDQS